MNDFEPVQRDKPWRPSDDDAMMARLGDVLQRAEDRAHRQGQCITTQERLARDRAQRQSTLPPRNCECCPESVQRDLAKHGLDCLCCGCHPDFSAQRRATERREARRAKPHPHHIDCDCVDCQQPF